MARSDGREREMLSRLCRRSKDTCPLLTETALMIAPFTIHSFVCRPSFCSVLGFPGRGEPKVGSSDGREREMKREN